MCVWDARTPFNGNTGHKIFESAFYNILNTYLNWTLYKTFDFIVFLPIILFYMAVMRAFLKLYFKNCSLAHTANMEANRTRIGLTISVQKLWENIEEWPTGALKRNPSKYQKCDIWTLIVGSFNIAIMITFTKHIAQRLFNNHGIDADANETSVEKAIPSNNPP